MRAVRIYQPGHYQLGQILTLNQAASQHVGLVLRLTVGDKITLFCGDNTEYLACITAIKKKLIEVSIETITEVSRESALQVHLAQSLVKGDKMDWIIQKAVELGVASITPLVTDRSVVRLDGDRLEKKRQHWQTVCIGACEQSGRNQIPPIHQALSFEQFLSQSDAKFTYMLSPQAEASWPKNLNSAEKRVILIGPEGGFSQQEVTFATQHQVRGIRMGPRILRAETAAITAIAVMQALYGDL